MRRVVLAVLVLIAIVLAINTVTTDRQTKAAAADVGQIVDTRFGDVQVRERGPARAPAIVLIHCYTCSIHWWLKLEPLLTGDRRVVSVDLLGHGGSEKPLEGYSAENQADAVAAALRRRGVRDALLVGQSLGGPIATAVAERNPGLARGVVIMDSSPREGYGDLPFTQKIGTAPVVGQAAWHTTPDFMIRDGLADAFAEGFEVPDQFVEDVRRMTFTSFKEADKLPGYQDTPLPERLTATGLPVLVIFGEEDTVIVPPDEAADEYRAIPGARVALLPGVGHTPQVEAPRRTAALLRSFDRGTMR
ncbi:MAG TPA: alpha/beta fold hydrolase [Thermoleophilaceae bacterium]|nr:alpha/beta fold hydrolase [Thermoleophilaceae bacterium]